MTDANGKSSRSDTEMDTSRSADTTSASASASASAQKTQSLHEPSMPRGIFSQTATIIVGREQVVKWYLFSIFLSLALGQSISFALSWFDTPSRIAILLSVSILIFVGWDFLIIYLVRFVRWCTRLEEREHWWVRFIRHVHMRMNQRMAVVVQVEHTPLSSRVVTSTSGGGGIGGNNNNNNFHAYARTVYASSSSDDDPNFMRRSRYSHHADHGYSDNAHSNQNSNSSSNSTTSTSPNTTTTTTNTNITTTNTTTTSTNSSNSNANSNTLINIARDASSDENENDHENESETTSMLLVLPSFATPALALAHPPPVVAAVAHNVPRVAHSDRYGYPSRKIDFS